MRKTSFSTLCMLALVAVGCQNSPDNNQALTFDTLDVNFKGSLDGLRCNEGAEVAIFASCTREEKSSTPMSTNANAKYTTAAEGESTLLQRASEMDNISANASDHNFQFYAYYPFSEEIADKTAIEVSVPQEQSYAAGPQSYAAFAARKNLTTVVPTVNLEFKGIFSFLELYLPSDAIEEDEAATLRTLTLKPTVADNFDGTLAGGGTYNIETDTFTPDADGGAQQIVVDFGDEGLALTDAFTKITLVVTPFTVPEGGMDVVITATDGRKSTIKILDKAEESGTPVAAGDILTRYLTRGSDGIIPVTFPVVFPLGYENNAYVFSTKTQPRWISESIWVCPAQTQAYAEWVKVSDPSNLCKQTIEYVNSTSSIGSPGIKGIWTGDYFEFVLPVKKFAAGSSVTLTFPMYTRQGPVFWVIEYLDGTEWKCNKEVMTCYDAAYSREATFTLIRGGKVIEHTMTFQNGVKSGYLKFRVKCADGTIQADAEKTVAVRTTPWLSGTAYAAPFYFYLAGSDVKSVTFSIN